MIDFLPNIKDPSVIQHVQGKYLQILYRYIKYKNNHDSALASIKISQISRLTQIARTINVAECRDLQDSIESFLQLRRYLRMGKDGFFHLPGTSQVG